MSSQKVHKHKDRGGKWGGKSFDYLFVNEEDKYIKYFPQPAPT